jgi:DNA-binding transcriptional LysR family regulator
MQLETLKMFCDIAELRSFSKTAEKHMLSQSAVSQNLGQLELAYKCQLIERKKRPIQLTKAGRLLYKAAQDILDRYAQFHEELVRFRSSGGYRINVGAIYSIGMHALPNYVKDFMLGYPNVNVNVEYFRAYRIYELILAGDVDVGLVAIPQKDKRFDVYDFEYEPLVLACSPNHTLAQQPQVDIHQLQFERFIAFEKDAPTRGWIDAILGRYNVTVRTVMEFDNVETIKRAVEINHGISILPKITLLQEAATGSIRAIEFSNEQFVRPTGIILRRNKLLGRFGRHFLDLLLKEKAR